MSSNLLRDPIAEADGLLTEVTLEEAWKKNKATGRERWRASCGLCGSNWTSDTRERAAESLSEHLKEVHY